MIKKHKILFNLFKIKLWLLGIYESRVVYCYSDEIGKFKFVKGIIESITGDSINDNLWEVSINIKFNEPLKGNDTRYYTSGSYDLKSFKEKIRFNPKFKKGEEVYYRRGSDKEPQWGRINLIGNYLNKANEFIGNYVPVNNSCYYDRCKVINS